jgi:hypothetical protein
MPKIEGGCLCGAVRYECDAEPALTAICHCKHCQKQAGTAFSTLVGVPRGSLKLSGKPLKTYHDTGESGQPVLREFCEECGSAVISDVSVMPDLLFIKAGTLDDTSWLSPQVQIWTDHKLAWADIAGETASFPGNPPPG